LADFIGMEYRQIASTAIALQAQTAEAEPSATATLPASPTPESTNTPQKSTNTPVPSKTPTARVPVVPATPNPAGSIPSMSVTLITNDTYPDSATVPANQALIFRAQVKNTSFIPLQVVANLTIPVGWGVNQNAYSDCPKTESLDYNHTCTFSWYFTPQGSGIVYLRVYVRGIYTDSAGNTQRITVSPAFIFTLEP
jgi:hypothetical protein